MRGKGRTRRVNSLFIVEPERETKVKVVNNFLEKSLYAINSLFTSFNNDQNRGNILSKGKNNINHFFVIFLALICATSSIQRTSAVVLNDGANDILHIVDDVYQGTVNVHDEIDIDSIEITTTHVYLTLQEAPNTVEFRRYSIEIYWDDIVEERGFNFYKNQTKCVFDNEDHYSDSKAWNAQNEQVSGSYDPGALRSGNVITFPIHTEPFMNKYNPKTVFVKTIYSETLEIAYPNGTIEEWIDYYPDESQTYSDTADLAFIGVTITSLVTAVILIKAKKKK